MPPLPSVLRKIRNECPLWADGIKIDRHHASADKKIEDLFNKILEGIVSLRDKEQFAGKDYSLGTLVEKFLDIQEATQRETLLGLMMFYVVSLYIIFRSQERHPSKIRKLARN